MPDKKETALQVAAIGMDQRSLSTLQMFFKIPCRNSCRLVAEDAAEVAMLDMDAVDAGKLFERHRERFPDRPVIVLSLSGREITGTINVRKPLSVTLMLDAIAQARKQLVAGPAAKPDPLPDSTGSNVVLLKQEEKVQTSRVGSSAAAHRAALQLDEKEFRSLVGSAPDIDPGNADQRASVCFNPDDYMLGHISKVFAEARNNGSAIRLEDSWSTLTVFPGQDMVATELKDPQLRTVYVMSNRPKDMRQTVLDAGRADREYRAMEEKQALQDMDAFLWKLALWTSRGRIPDGTSLSVPVFLRHWPNMTRLLLPPHALRITALWAYRPHSLIQTASALRIPQRFVFALYSAATVLDLVGPCRRSSDMLVEPSTAASENRSVLARILQRLKIA